MANDQVTFGIFQATLQSGINQTHYCTMRYFFQTLIVCVLCVLPFIGCGKQYGGVPVSGIVSYDGKPVESATVTLMPSDGDNPVASARTDNNGRYLIRTAVSGKVYNTVLPGKYRVTIRKFDIGNSIQANTDTQSGRPLGVGTAPPSSKPVKMSLPSVYFKEATTPLEIIVENGKKNNFDFILSGDLK
ncbi:MAG: carboxypeptidase-like regulatory domain-containing protein [Thermoguttaceae bacterium]